MFDSQVLDPPALAAHVLDSQVLDAQALDSQVLRPRELSQGAGAGTVAYEMLSADAALPLGGIDLKDHMSTIEIGLIRKALEEADGTVAGAARLLRIRRTTLVEKLRKYHLSA